MYLVAVQMISDPNDGGAFSVTLQLPPGLCALLCADCVSSVFTVELGTYEYRFIVDGQM